MAPEVLKRTVTEIFSSDLIEGQVTFVWHAGEPMAVPIAWYQDAFGIIQQTAPDGVRIVHSFQSNGTLINDRWCEFIKASGICLGLSIDGPAFLHDVHRRTRKGVGTHEAAMRGVRLLQDHGIFFHVIAVVTREALGHADAVFDFFVENGIRHFGFNIEETEGIHTTSSLDGSGDDAIEAFFSRMFERQREAAGAVRIREFDSALDRITQGRSREAEAFVWENEQVRPFGILSVDWQGNFSTFSPELLGLDLKPYGQFSFGSVLDAPFADAVRSEKFLHVLGDVRAGVEKCRSECGYFSLCGGGAPANKYFENGSFSSSETRYCKYAVKVPTDLVLNDLEASLPALRP